MIFGKDAKTYYSTDLKTTTSDAGSKTWVESTNIQDETDNFTAEEVDVTTRLSAQQGWSATATTIKNGEITFGVLMDAADAFVTLLMDAFLNAGEVAVMCLTGDKDDAGNFGLAANFSVSMTFPKPVKGVQTADVTLKVRSFPEWVET